jgi:endonuclease-3
MPTFAEKVKRLERLRLLLKRRYGEQPPPAVAHPVEFAIRTILAEEATRPQVDACMDRFRQHFVDWNDLRVSRPREIREVMGKDFPRSGRKARAIPRLLDQVFKLHNSMVWDFLEAMGKLGVRSYFESLEEVRPFVAATIARDCLAAHTFPVDSDVARALGRLGILRPEEQSESEMQAFLERAVKSTRAYETHQLIRRLGEDLCVLPEPLCERCPLRNLCPTGEKVLAERKEKAAKAKQAAAAKKQAAKAKSKKAAKRSAAKSAAAASRKAVREKAAKRQSPPGARGPKERR